MGRFILALKKNFNHEFSIVRLFAILFLIGVALGSTAAVLLRNDFSEQAQYLFAEYNSGGLPEIYLQQIVFFLLLFFMGLTVVGVPLLPLFPLYKGFSLGFLIAISIIISGVRGVLFGTLAFFAQNALYTTLGYFMCFSSARLSVSLFESLKGKSKHGGYYREFKRHMACFLMVVPLLFLGSLWEYYVVPVFLHLI